MSKRRLPVKAKPPLVPRGRRGKTGPQGPQGPPGRDNSQEIRVLSAQVAQIVKELQTQLVRIAQIQAQLDHLAGEPGVGSRDADDHDDSSRFEQ